MTTYQCIGHNEPERLERLQLELREVTLDPHSPTDLTAIRARRHELDVAISQQERALEEASRVLGASRVREVAALPRVYPR
jgi:hypothetical protein